MNGLAHDWIVPAWPAPARVKACITTRAGGVSVAPFDSLNLGTHVGDDPVAVKKNRQRLVSQLGCKPAWLQQVHGLGVVEALPEMLAEADASWTATPGIACTVMTADCLPALFCDRGGSRVAAAHAGWRGLAAGVLEATLDALAVAPEDTLVWLGPAIGPQAFEVGTEVREAFLAQHARRSRPLAPASTPVAIWRISISWRVFAWPPAGSMRSTAAIAAPTATHASTLTVALRKPAASPA